MNYLLLEAPNTEDSENVKIRTRCCQRLFNRQLLILAFNFKFYFKTMAMELIEILPKLQEYFLAHEHKDRVLPGGGKWVFIPWQTIRDRLNKVCPADWTVSYSDPVVAGDYTAIRCKLTICGVTREGVGNDKAYPEVNEKGKAKTIGTPIERATADAFKNAAEQFGIAAYLDDQKLVTKILNSQKDNRAVQYAKENEWKQAGAMGERKELPKLNSGERFNKFAEITSVPIATITSICTEACPGKTINKLTDADATKLRNRVLIHWGTTKYQITQDKATNLFKTFWGSGLHALSDAQIFDEWTKYMSAVPAR